MEPGSPSAVMAYPLPPVSYGHTHPVQWNYHGLTPYSPRLAAPPSLQITPDILRTPIPINPLPLATPPMHWSRDDVIKWLRWSQEEFSLNDIDVSKFCMNGKGLLMLTKQDFKDRAAYAGDVLYEMLERLKRKDIYQPFQKYPPLSPISPSGHDQRSSPRHHVILRQNSCQHGAEQANVTLENGFNSSMETLEERKIQEEERLTTHQSILIRHVPVQEPIPTPPNSVGHCRNGSLPPSDDDRHSTSPQATSSDSDQNDQEILHDRSRDEFTKEYNQATPLDLSTLSQPGKPNSDCRLLWEFLYFLLSEEATYSSYIKWEDKSNQIFRIIKPSVIAYLWGRQKNRKNMTYDKLSRALRYYYKMKILLKEEGQKLTYRFLKRPSELQPSPEYSKLQHKVQFGDENDNFTVKAEEMSQER
ncbi:transcription factor ETV6-like [Ptychodera flava]|uniref:transcription factor ETV6-like n=1 Tax=Ptychodera flava TaxID=63121 RepID=UPI00396A5996